MCAEVARCVAIISVPLFADMEGGYGAAPEDVAETVLQAIRVGAVGANIEDSMAANNSPMFGEKVTIERIRAGRRAADDTGISFVLNARTDVESGKHSFAHHTRATASVVPPFGARWRQLNMTCFDFGDRSREASPGPGL